VTLSIANVNLNTELDFLIGAGWPLSGAIWRAEAAAWRHDEGGNAAVYID
jgi:hypothetical protein